MKLTENQRVSKGKEKYKNLEGPGLMEALERAIMELTEEQQEDLLKWMEEIFW